MEQLELLKGAVMPLSASMSWRCSCSHIGETGSCSYSRVKLPLFGVRYLEAAIFLVADRLTTSR
ncbi:hypothetical protein KSP40_PGU011198 [Platanthera guangdongensis]|uniref:Uncharacterized protein n=1 Tax=Platanthera guangdongensis TaxID=2320717 RepID=A0ABR2LX90_9ASPA